VNPAFDTYRIGTLLEMVRTIALKLSEDGGKRVRICVQQSLGQGIFLGMPLAISAMRPVLERMDWGGVLSESEKFQQSDNDTPRKEALIRLGTVGAEQVAEDDDVLIVISPQNGTTYDIRHTIYDIRHTTYDI
jgi:adenylate kinase